MRYAGQPMYCTKANIISLELTQKELIQLTDDADLGAVDDAMVATAIAKADAEIDAYCQNAYTVPFTTVPTIVMGWSATLAAFYLHRNRKKPETLIDRYNKAMSWLKSISEGKSSIPGVTEDPSMPESTTQDYVQVFQREQKDSDGVVLQEGTMEVW
jgi:phage gp36-like protein